MEKDKLKEESNSTPYYLLLAGCITLMTGGLHLVTTSWREKIDPVPNVIYNNYSYI